MPTLPVVSSPSASLISPDVLAEPKAMAGRAMAESLVRIEGHDRASMGRIMLVAAWWAIVLGISMQVIVAGAGLLSGGTIAGWPGQVVETAGKVTWSVLVCGGLIAGGVASRWQSRKAGVIAAMAAPAAFLAAKLAGKAIATSLKVAPPGESAAWLMATIAVLKAAQYGLLAVALAWLSRQEWGGLKEYLGAGALIGAFFGGIIVIVGVTGAAAVPPVAKMVAMSANEVLFPIGCAAVTFVTAFMKNRADAG